MVVDEATLPDGKTNKGLVQAYYGPIYIADAALYLKSHRPELGITDPYELDQKQFDAAFGKRSVVTGANRIVAFAIVRWHDATQTVGKPGFDLAGIDDRVGAFHCQNVADR